MAKRLPIQAGDVLLIPLSDSAAILGKILFINTKTFKGMLTVGVATDHVFDPRKPPAARLASWQQVKFASRSAVDQGHWPVLGHDPSPIPPDATMRIMAGGVFMGEELVRYATPEDMKRIPEQALGGHVATEYWARGELGIPEPPAAPRPAKTAGRAQQARDARSGALDEDRFWAMIEDAWKSAAPALAKKRPGVAAKVSAKDADALGDALSEDVIPALERALGELSREELIEFDRILEKKLYDIDRADVQRYTDGSDDGFLYARGFIVGMGRPHYEAVRADPSKAISVMEGEEMTYLPHRVFEKRFDEDLPRSDISRETGSNKAGWR